MKDDKIKKLIYSGPIKTSNCYPVCYVYWWPTEAIMLSIEFLQKITYTPSC